MIPDVSLAAMLRPYTVWALLWHCTPSALSSSSAPSMDALIHLKPLSSFMLYRFILFSHFVSILSNSFRLSCRDASLSQQYHIISKDQYIYSLLPQSHLLLKPSLASLSQPYVFFCCVVVFWHFVVVKCRPSGVSVIRSEAQVCAVPGIEWSKSPETNWSAFSYHRFH